MRARGEEHPLDMRRRSTMKFSWRPPGVHRGRLTLPAASRITKTKELLEGRLGEEHLLYSVARLTPSCSRLYVNDQVSASCSRGGSRSRISSARARERICADGGEVGAKPMRDRGVRGGG